jgi:hypothetical protein
MTISATFRLRQLRSLNSSVASRACDYAASQSAGSSLTNLLTCRHAQLARLLRSRRSRAKTKA